jgi:hypothetical protein
MVVTSHEMPLVSRRAFLGTAAALSMAATAGL